MRGLTLATLLAALPACSIDNPAFGLASDVAGPGGSSGAGSTGDPVTTGLATTGASPTTVSTEASESGTTVASSTSPVDTTGQTGSSSGGPSPMCAPIVGDALDPHVEVDGVLVTDCKDEASRTIHGKVDMSNGVMVLETNVACGGVEEGTTVTFGAGYPLPDRFSGCAEATVTWNKVNGDCAIGLLDIRHALGTPIYYVGAFDFPTPPDFPIQAAAMQSTKCGCPDDIPGCCAPLDAGELTLTPAGGVPIAAQQHGPVTLADDTSFEFYNLQSHVDAMCGRHIEWIAERIL